MRIGLEVKELVAVKLGIENQLPAIGAYHPLVIVEVSKGRLSRYSRFFTAQDRCKTLCSNRCRDIDFGKFAGRGKHVPEIDTGG